jgi:hypothetical protein
LSSLLHFLKDTQMTLNATTSHDTSTAATTQQHHTQAAEHLELAAKSHKEAAKLIGANDHAAAQTHVKTAHGHVTKAQDHVVEAAKKSASAAK